MTTTDPTPDGTALLDAIRTVRAAAEQQGLRRLVDNLVALTTLAGDAESGPTPTNIHALLVKLDKSIGTSYGHLSGYVQAIKDVRAHWHLDLRDAKGAVDIYIESDLFEGGRGAAAVTAQKLRDAAAVIREMAQSATPGPWTIDERRPRWITTGAPIDVDEADWGSEGHTAYRLGTNADAQAWRYGDVRHIALWSPPVALAVADWLGEVACQVQRLNPKASSEMLHRASHALAVADLILSGASTARLVAEEPKP